MKQMVECSKCKNDTKKQKLIMRQPLKDISNELPEHLKEENKEFSCQNLVQVYLSNGTDANGKKIKKWFTETCNNHILLTGVNKSNESIKEAIKEVT